MDHILKNDDALREIGQAAGRTTDMIASRAIAQWGYSNASTSGAQAWLRAGVYEKVGPGYLESWT